MNYKIGEPQLQLDRVDIMLKKEVTTKKIRSTNPWAIKFGNILRAINEQERNISSIYNELVNFKIGITEENFPSIDFLLEENVLSFFFCFLQEDWQHSLKLSCLGIFERLIINIKAPLLDLINDVLINSFLSLLFNPDLINDSHYTIYSYNITQIFKISSNLSSNFALSLHSTKFYSEYVLTFFNKYNNRILSTPGMTTDETPKMYLPNDDCIYGSFFNIIKIFGTWIGLKDSITDEFISELINNFIQIIHLNNVFLNNIICKTIFQCIEERETLFLILLRNNFFQLLWDLIKEGKETKFALEILSYSLISDDDIQKSVADIIDINIILRKLNSYIQFIPEAKNIKKVEEMIESLITLIANYINFFDEWPSYVLVGDVLALTENIFLDANYHIKACASFLILVVLEFNDPLEIESTFSEEFIDNFFSVLLCTENDIVDKAIDVFTTILDKASKHNYDISNSNLYNIFIPNFLRNYAIINQFTENSEKACNLLENYYHISLDFEYDDPE